MTRPCRIPVGLDVVLSELGIAAADVCRHAGLPRRVLEVARAEVSPRDYLRLWAAIPEAAGDPAVGLAIGSTAAPDALEPVLMAALSSRNLRDALHRIAAFKRLLANEEVTVHEGEAGVTVRYRSPDPGLRAPTCLVDAELAFLINLARRGTRSPVRPLAVRLRRPALASPDAYREVFGVQPALQQPDDGMLLAHADVDRAFVTHNAPLLALLDPQLEAAAARVRSGRSATARVREVLGDLTSGGRPTLAEVATGLAVSSRTLQRQLRAEGTSFVQVLADARRDLAEFYLTKTPWTPAEIAYLLGYEDISSFYRAFQSWTGTTPGDFRVERASQADDGPG